SPMPGISTSCSGVISASFSMEMIPAASSFSMVLGPTPASSDNAVPGAVRAAMRLDFAALFFFALNINVPADQLAGEANVLPLFADGEGKLRILDDHLEALLLRIHDL